MDLKGKTVLITGGARRIGRAIALAFASQGSAILLHYHASRKEALSTQREILKMGVSCTLLRADLSREASIRRLQNTAALSKISILVNSASIFYKRNIQKINSPDLKDNMQIHAAAPFYLSRLLGLRCLKTKRQGVIINITDASLRRPFAGYLAYYTSKSALEQMTRSLSVELGPYVRVNTIAPGAIVFPPKYRPEEQKKIIARVPLKRQGHPSDIAEACLFISRCDFINGMTLTVDGGRSLQI